MKIAFWSSARGSSGVTSNLACISIASAMEYSYKSVLIENHYQKNKLGNILMYQRANYLEREANYQFSNLGIDYIMNQFSKGNDDYKVPDNSHVPDQESAQIIKEASLVILDNFLYYIPVSYHINQETFDYNLYGNIKEILNAAEEFADITYIDTSGQNNLSSKIILEEADLVVVNLVQNSFMIQYFFDNYSSILNKCVFLISNYNKNSTLNLNNISKTHSISKPNIAAIPYNIEYQEAVSQGTVVEFLSRNYTCKRQSPNYTFIREVKKAAAMIIKNAAKIRQKEECL
ncbi:hypothetical protein Ana3638_20580 [Anaerocolumna sedimenticola]|uniref:AAA domain-containing protein n=1 Tax=Anaerocolumna sedimenticola TaxID=2696063 RepID=A0A6P1TNR0_9FIRM|nr:hypothetical protein [Anaerocolumna sedimenticola]QHQ62880.1 hypothetical protein Ana3638_20580 [Anaerocolumna sedimenticola]